MEYSGERFLPEECTGEIKIEHLQRYQMACQFCRDKIVLDAACGEGYGSSLIAKQAKQVTGLDIDADTIKRAAQKYGSDNLDFVTGDVCALPFGDDACDAIVSFETLEHIDQASQRKFLQEIGRVLKPEGILIISTPNKAVYTDLVCGSNKFHLHEFYAQEFLDFLAPAFRHVNLYCQFPDVGYFLAREGQETPVSHGGQTADHSRYLIAVCSNGELTDPFDERDMNHFDDSMYYFLCRQSHELEDKLLATTKEAKAFQIQLEDNISGLDAYVKRLEEDREGQKTYIKRLESERSEQKTYIERLESERSGQKTYIERLEKETLELSEYAKHLEADLQAQNYSLQELGDTRRTLEEYIEHKEKEIQELAEYVRHLENDINVLNKEINTRR